MLEFLSQTKIPNLRDSLRQGWGDLSILWFLAKRIRCVWGKTAFSGIHTSCVKDFRSKVEASGVGGGDAGVEGAHPQIFWFDENSGKICVNLGKMCENRFMCFDFTKKRFMCFDFTKIALCTLILQKWRRNQSADVFFLEVMFFQFFFGQVKGNLGKFAGNLGKNGAWSALIWKNAPKMEWNPVIFLRSFPLEFFSDKFGEIWAKSLAPPKLCLLLHLCLRLWAFRACSDCKR